MNVQTDPRSTRTDRLTLVLACVGGFMLLLDLTVVNLALPVIAQDLSTTIDGLKWVINAYALSLGSLLLLGGTIADITHRRTVFSAAVLVFAGASLGCGLSNDVGLLVAFRALQGASGAFVSCGALALLAQQFTGQRRLRALAVFSAAAASATALGPLVGGLFTEYAGWRAVFLINVPVGILVAAAATRLGSTPGARTGRAFVRELRGLDWAGAALFAMAMLAVNRFLLDGTEYGWSSWRIGGWAAGAVAASTAFVVVELRAPRPMLPMRYLRRPRLGASMLTSFAIRAATFGGAFYLAMFFQINAGLSPVAAGVRTLPLTLGIVVGAIVADRVGGWLDDLAGTPATFLVLAGGLGWLAAVDQTSGLAVVGPLVVTGVATGALSTSALSAAISELPTELSGLASSITTTFMSIGTAAGVALLGIWAGVGRGAPATTPITSLGEVLLFAALVPVIASVGWLLLRVRAGRSGGAHDLSGGS